MIDIFDKLNAAYGDQTLADSDQIKDKKFGKKQDVLNKEILDPNDPNSLKSKVDSFNGIVIDPDNAVSTDKSDIEAGSSKIPTGNAVAGALADMKTEEDNNTTFKNTLLKPKDVGIDDVPTIGSDNLVKSGGVENMRVNIEEGTNVANIVGANGSFNICSKKIGVTQGKKYKITISGSITPYNPSGTYALRIALVKLDGTYGGVIYNLLPSETFVTKTIEYTAPYSGYLFTDGQITAESSGTINVEDITVRTFADSTIDNDEKIVNLELLNSEVKYANEGYIKVSLIGQSSGYAYLNHSDLAVKKGCIYSLSTTAGSESVQEGVRTTPIILIRLNYFDGTYKTLYYIDHGGTFTPTTINFEAEKPGTIHIEGNLSATSVINIELTDINDALVNTSLDFVSKPKELDITWQNYGILISGVQGTSDTCKHAEILLNKGDIIKVISNTVGLTYAPISLVLGENSYKPLLVFRNDWTTFEYIIPETGTYAITGRYNSSNIITVQCISSETFSYINDKIIDVNRILGNRTIYLDSPNKATQIPVEWESGQITATGEFQPREGRIRTKDYILIDNLVLLRVKSSVKYWVCLYDENYVAISGTSTDRRIAYNANVDAAIVLNTLVWKYKQYKPKYAIVFVDTTDSSVIQISGDTLQAILNNRRILNSKTVKCAAHQGIQMHIQQDGLERSFGNNMLSSFWGDYLCGFDMNLVNHRYTSDGVPVCAHDDQVTDDDGNVITISNLTLSELNTHTFGEETIPTLDSVIYLSKMLGMEVFLVNVDVLSGQQDRLNTVLSLIDKYRMWRYVWLMCSGNTLTSVLAYNSKARVAICQNPIDSVDVNDALAAVEAAEAVMTNDNEVMVWLNGEHDPSSLETVALAANSKLKIGCYNIGTTDSNYDDKLVIRLPYLDVYSSHYSSYGASLRNIELGVATKYPTIISWENGNII